MRARLVLTAAMMAMLMSGGTARAGRDQALGGAPPIVAPTYCAPTWTPAQCGDARLATLRVSKHILLFMSDAMRGRRLRHDVRPLPDVGDAPEFAVGLDDPETVERCSTFAYRYIVEWQGGSLTNPRVSYTAQGDTVWRAEAHTSARDGRRFTQMITCTRATWEETAPPPSRSV